MYKNKLKNIQQEISTPREICSAFHPVKFEDHFSGVCSDRLTR